VVQLHILQTGVGPGLTGGDQRELGGGIVALDLRLLELLRSRLRGAGRERDGQAELLDPVLGEGARAGDTLQC
jgi:hypothetical protein